MDDPFSESRGPSRPFAAGCSLAAELHHRRIVICCVERLPIASVASTLTVTTLRFGSGWPNFRFCAVVASVKSSLSLMKTLTVAICVSSVTVMGRVRCRHELAVPKMICGGGVATPAGPVDAAALGIAAITAGWIDAAPGG